MSRFGLGWVGGLNGNDSFTKILLHMDGSNGGTSFPDVANGGSAHTWTATGATTSTSSPKFGTASMSGPYIDTPDSADFTLGASDWTVDYWLNTNGAGAGTARFLTGQANSALSAATTSFTMSMTVGNVVSASISDGAAFSAAVTGTTAITTAAWHHIALVRTGNVLKLFIDGTQEGGNIAIAFTVNDSANKFAVGRAGERTTNPFTGGSIDEFRLSVGIARWTANFTPPTLAYS